MRSLGQFIKIKQEEKKMVLDDKTIFFVFERIIKEEYGNVGKLQLKPSYYKQGKLFVKSENSSWANELWQSRERIAKKINEELGKEEVREIKVN